MLRRLWQYFFGRPVAELDKEVADRIRRKSAEMGLDIFDTEDYLRHVGLPYYDLHPRRR